MSSGTKTDTTSLESPHTDPNRSRSSVKKIVIILNGRRPSMMLVENLKALFPEVEIVLQDATEATIGAADEDQHSAKRRAHRDE